MNKNSLCEELSPLYEDYLKVIKPLIVDIERFYKKFPFQLYNEIRAFNDHVARCYDAPNQETIGANAKKARGHIDRIMLDCYKFLDVKLFDRIIKRFERRTKRIDLGMIDNGDFYRSYQQIRGAIVGDYKEARRLEAAEDKKPALDSFDKVYQGYRKLEDLLLENERKICWAIAKFSGKKMFAIIGWFLSAVISGILSIIIANDEIHKAVSVLIACLKEHVC